MTNEEAARQLETDKDYRVLRRVPPVGLSDVDWRVAGIDSGKLAYLLTCYGYFFEGHRALDDALATAFLLTRDVGRQTALFALLAKARDVVYEMSLNTPCEANEAVRAYGGFKWHADKRRWVKETLDPEGELPKVFEAVGYRPACRRMPPIERHRRG